MKYVIVLIFIFMWPAPRSRTILEEQTILQPVKLLLTFCTPEYSSWFSQDQATILFSAPHVVEKDGEDQLDDHVRNEEVLLRVNEERNILHEIRKRKANWIGHI